jgi:hypothetical protein
MRFKKRVDDNQKEIVKKLRSIPGVSVELDHDDILVGFQNETYWYEIKNPNKSNKKGEVFESAKKKSQKKLLSDWSGHYRIVTSVDEILEEIL